MPETMINASPSVAGQMTIAVKSQKQGILPFG